MQPLVHACHLGADWGMTADVLAELGIGAPDPFDIWCGLLVRRVWTAASSYEAQEERSQHRGVGPVSWDDALAAGREGEQLDRNDLMMTALYRC